MWRIVCVFVCFWGVFWKLRICYYLYWFSNAFLKNAIKTAVLSLQNIQNSWNSETTEIWKKTVHFPNSNVFLISAPHNTPCLGTASVWTYISWSHTCFMLWQCSQVANDWIYIYIYIYICLKSASIGSRCFLKIKELLLFVLI